MFFDTEPGSWSFRHASMPQTLHRDVDEARSQLRSLDPLRPSVFYPRPFQQRERPFQQREQPFQQRERRTSAGSGCCTSEEDARSHASSNSSYGEPDARSPRERVIPITIEVEQPATVAPQRPPRKLSRRPAADQAPAGGENGDERDSGARSRPALPLDISAARAAQQRGANQPTTYGKPNYFNSSPKPFSPGARPFHVSFSGVSSASPTSVKMPAHMERADTVPRQPPKIAPKPNMAGVRQQRAVNSPKQVALQKVAAVQAEMAPLSDRLAAFHGVRGDKEYLYLDEMLTRQLIRLDDVDTQGDEQVRSARRETIGRVQKSLLALEYRCSHTESAAVNGELAPRSVASGHSAEAEGDVVPSATETEAAAAETVTAETETETAETETATAETETETETAETETETAETETETEAAGHSQGTVRAEPVNVRPAPEGDMSATGARATPQKFHQIGGQT